MPPKNTIKTMYLMRHIACLRVEYIYISFLFSVSLYFMSRLYLRSSLQIFWSFTC